MNLQYIIDIGGNKSAVQIPIKEWDYIQKRLMELKELKEQSELFKELKEAFNDIEQYEQGNMELKTAKQILNEL